MKTTLLILLVLFLTSCETTASKVDKVITVQATQSGYKPSLIEVPKSAQKVTVRFERITEHTCAQEVVYEEQNINERLPLKKPVEITFDLSRTDKIKYGCHMDKMHHGIIIKK
jgi:plastocyanin domain-containing protein